jgi:hypothetical protein
MTGIAAWKGRNFRWFSLVWQYSSVGSNSRFYARMRGWHGSERHSLHVSTRFPKPFPIEEKTMKTSKRSLMAVLAIGALMLTATSASAGGFNFGGGGGGGGGGNNGNKSGGNSSGFKLNFGGNSNHKHSVTFHNNKHHDGHHHGHHHHHHVKYYRPVHVHYSQCYHPQFCLFVVCHGDNWYTISKQMYGVSFLGRHIASYNGLSVNTFLMPGQQLRLPVVNANGSLSASSAPLPPQFAPQGIPVVGQGSPIGPQTTQFGAPTTQFGQPGAMMTALQGVNGGMAPQGLPNGSIQQGLPAGSAPQDRSTGLAPQGLPSGLTAGPNGPQSLSMGQIPNAALSAQLPATAKVASATTAIATIRPEKEAPALPRVAIGSTLSLDGQSLGNERGIVRLRIGGLSLPVNVIEWSASSVKIELPQVELSRPVKADLDVMRADGSVASNSAIELTPATTRLALSN